MYQRKYDSLPKNYWILNEGDVDILKLDVGEEVIENTESNKAEPSLSADILVSSSNEAVPGAVSSEYNAQHTFNEELQKHGFARDESHQFLLELPNNCTLLMCFLCVDEAVKFYEEILTAKKFQVDMFR